MMPCLPYMGCVGEGNVNLLRGCSAVVEDGPAIIEDRRRFLMAGAGEGDGELLDASSGSNKSLPGSAPQP
jgi:hypothetical protein